MRNVYRACYTCGEIMAARAKTLMTVRRDPARWSTSNTERPLNVGRVSAEAELSLRF